MNLQYSQRHAVVSYAEAYALEGSYLLVHGIQSERFALENKLDFGDGVLLLTYGIR